MKKCTALAFSAMFLLTGCGKTLNITESLPDTTTTAEETSAPAANKESTGEVNNSDESKAETTSAEESKGDTTNSSGDGVIVITLHPDIAPITCENFEMLVNEGFYDGLTFHRVVEGFMAQGGDPLGTGMGGSTRKIKGEFSSNGVENKLSHKRGVVSMARSMDPNSASCQFFICYDDSCTFLDGGYAAFGKVTEGMEVVDDFLKVEREMSSSGELSSPKTPITMDKVEMYTKDSEGHDRVLVTMQDFLPKQ